MSFKDKIDEMMGQAIYAALEEKKLDPVNKKALDKDFDDRKDKDIDNDGDVDSSDEYLHNRRKAIKKAMTKESIELDEEELDEIYSMSMKEAADPSKYKAGSEASKFGGHRPHLKNPEGKTSYVGGTAYKTASHAAGEAAAYHKGYFHSAGTKASESGAQRAVRAYREKNKQHIYTKE